MPNPWFRQYAEFATDPKVQMMPENYQRRLVMLFCLRCNGDVTLQDDAIAFQLRVTLDEWNVTKDIFMKNGFIDSKNILLNWDKRQYKSDTSNERVKRYRERHRNVTETPPDTESDIDTESENKPLTPFSNDFEIFFSKCSKQIGKAEAWEQWQWALNYSTPEILIIAMDGYNLKMKSDDPKFTKMPQNWLAEKMWLDPMPELPKPKTPTEIIIAKVEWGIKMGIQNSGLREIHTLLALDKNVDIAVRQYFTKKTTKEGIEIMQFIDDKIARMIEVAKAYENSASSH